MNQSKIEFNKKAINKRCYCCVDKGFYGLIIDVKDELTFVVRDDFGKDHDVDIYDIRYIEQ